MYLPMPRKAKIESQADLNSAPGGVAAVDRALTLLTAFEAGDQSLSLGDFAERTGLYKSTSSRMLASLVHFGLLERRAGGTYALGSQLSRLHSVYQASFNLDEAVLPLLTDLMNKTGESAAFHVRQGSGANWVRLCLFRVDSTNTLRDHVRAGDVLPADRGAGARVLIAFGPPELQPQDKEAQALYRQIRANGYCANVGDRTPELGGISAPVLRANGGLVGAVTLTMPAHRYKEASIQHVVDTALELAKRIP